MTPRLSRRRFLPLAASALAGCSRSSPTKVLNVYLWAEYLPDDVIRDFEKEAACRLQVDTYNSNEEMITKAATGSCGYDLVCPSQYAVAQMASQNLLAPLDPTALPNRKHLDPRFLSLRADPDNKFAVPYLGASTGIGYHKPSLPNPPQRWADLFNPAFLAPLKGKLSILDDAREAAAIALMALGLPPNSSNPEHIAKAASLLTSQKPFVACYDSESFEDKLAAGICHAVHGYAGDFVAVMKDNPKIAFTLPAEGSVFNMDCFCLLAESRNQSLAHRFLDFILRPEIAARISSATGYPSANAAATPLIPESLRNHPCFQIPPADKLVMLDDCGPETRALYSKAWESVKLA